VTSRYWRQAILAGASFSFLCGVASATPQVVGDEACERFEVDIASFASCSDGKVVRPGAETIVVMAAGPVAERETPPYTGYFAPDARHRAAFTLAAIMLGPVPVQGANASVRVRSGCDDAGPTTTATAAQAR
jgi:hypothetical protein